MRIQMRYEYADGVGVRKLGANARLVKRKETARAPLSIVSENEADWQPPLFGSSIYAELAIYDKIVSQSSNKI